jgi:TPR repeat protein
MKGSNLERGLKYLRKAADMRYPKAYLNLGKCYENGLGVKVSEDKAKAMYI